MWRKDVIVVVKIFIALTYYTYELGGYMLAFATQIRMYLSIETHTKKQLPLYFYSFPINVAHVWEPFYEEQHLIIWMCLFAIVDHRLGPHYTFWGE